MKFNRPVSLALAAALVAALASSAHAEDRALLIGVAQYQNGDTLPGVDRDPQLMREVTRKLGFAEPQIRMLQDRAATKRGILDAIQTWLAQGVGPTDRAILYFSGHGYRVNDRDGDEEDGCDEALVPYDQDNLLLDDELNAALSRVPAAEILVVLDSCFSGTATKSAITGRTAAGRAEAKVLRKSATMACDKAINMSKGARGTSVVADRPEFRDPGSSAPSPTPRADARWVEFSAAAANEVALTAEGGSMFTLALHDRVVNDGSPVSFANLREYAAQYVRNKVEALGDATYRPHVPQLAGPSQFLVQDIFQFGRIAAPRTLPPRPVENFASSRELIDRYLNTSAFKTEVTSNATSYKAGDAIEYKVWSSNDGYLNLLELDDQGNIAVLFPNRYNNNNKIAGGRVYTLPSSELGNFRLRAAEPFGKTRVVALVTETPLDLSSVPGNQVGEFRVLVNLNHFREMARRMKGTSVEPLPTGNIFGASSVEIEVRP